MKTYKLIIIILLIVWLGFGFTNKVQNKIPININQSLEWKSSDLKNKHLIYSGKCGDIIKIKLIEINQNHFSSVIDTVLAKTNKLDLLISNYVTTSADHFCFSVQVNRDYYYKMIELY